ncbi:MAG TPA: pyridoxamine 5'-phosphate oxidase family protein [Myxococcota bacterium]|jgi:PPOX class probable F420-dependent enzyme
MSRRGLIEMSDDEVREFLTASKTIILTSIGPGGYPHPMPMWFGLDPDGTVRMTTFRASQKVKNLQRDPRVSLLAESGEEYAQLMGVVLYGRAQVIDDLEVVTQTLISVTTRGAPMEPAAREGMAKVVAKTAAKRVCILLKPERVVSWDHRKLGGTY